MFPTVSHGVPTGSNMSNISSYVRFISMTTQDDSPWQEMVRSTSSISWWAALSKVRAHGIYQLSHNVRTALLTKVRRLRTCAKLVMEKIAHWLTFLKCLNYFPPPWIPGDPRDPGNPWGPQGKPWETRGTPANPGDPVGTTGPLANPGDPVGTPGDPVGTIFEVKLVHESNI